MSDETIKEILKDFGLTATEIEVYLFLSKHGVLKGAEIARQIKKDKGQIYHLLKSLQTKGLVNSTLETPVRFTPIPFEKIVELNIKTKRDEAAHIENTKQELLNYWASINKNKLELSPTSKRLIVEKTPNQATKEEISDRNFFKDPIESTKNVKASVSQKNKWLSTKILVVLTVAIIVIVGLGAFYSMQPNFLGVSNLPTLSPSPSPSMFMSPSPSNSLSPKNSIPATTSPTASSTAAPSTTASPSPSINMAAKFYDSPAISADGNSVSLPYSFVDTYKIVNAEMKLQTPATSVTVGGKTVTLSQYRDGTYLPLLIIITPQGHLIAAIRVCEPCHTFSFSIVEGVLQCDSPCHTRWNLETFEGLSGMCAETSPPRVPASVLGDNIIVDLSQIQIN
ncbi:MAG: TrmB family transcriptional regulator [Candidatus Bathyarchaeia archaeon]